MSRRRTIKLLILALPSTYRIILTNSMPTSVLLGMSSTLLPSNDLLIPLFKSGHTISALAKMFNVQYGSIWARLVRTKLLTPRKVNCKYHVDEEFFVTINTELKAYWLGFLYADGCVRASENRVVLGLAAQDRGHLEQFAKDINHNAPLRCTPARQWLAKNGKIYHAQAQFKVDICRQTVKEQLERLGCTARKTFTLQFPTEEQVPTHLVHHFIRGYFDGDGYIGYDKSPTGKRYFYRFSLIGTKPFLSGIQSVLEKSGIRSTAIRPQGKVYVLTHSGNNVIKMLHAVLYQNCRRSLARKKKLFEACVQQPDGQKGSPRGFVFRKNGQEINIFNLSKFCHLHNLKIHRMRDRLRYGGSYEGYMFVRHLTPDEYPAITV